MKISTRPWLWVTAAMALVVAGTLAAKQFHRPAAPGSQETRPAGDLRTVELGHGIPLDFCWIPAGEFWMGSSFEEEGRAPMESYRHRVRLTRGFWMGRYPVTQEQWKQIMGDNPSNFQGRRLPVEQVNWGDCQGFIQALNRLLQTHHLQAALPTEAQWEYACRAGTQTRYYWGNAAEDLARAGWFAGNSGSKTHEVGRKLGNRWGLHDMHGNVWQWCQDWLDDYPRDAVVDPMGPGTGERRAMRGGSWSSDAEVCRDACRFCYPPKYRLFTAGLRIVAVER